jgi:hypothetical protein
VPETRDKPDLILPFSMLSGKSESAFQKDATIEFLPGNQIIIQNKQFVFHNSTLQKRESSQFPDEKSGIDPGSGIPFFSIGSVVLLILFRNLYFPPFQKYFVSLLNNYEIDFNFQKIGIVPMILSVLIIILAVSGFFFKPDLYKVNSIDFYLGQIRIPLEIFGYPLIISISALFFLSLSGKIFPLIFSDIKIFFGLSLLVLIWNFSAFGSDIERLINERAFFGGMVGLFFLLRSLLFFQVLRRAYRFHLPLTLFYICALNLSTFLILFKVLQKEFY